MAACTASREGCSQPPDTASPGCGRGLPAPRQGPDVSPGYLARAGVSITATEGGLCLQAAAVLQQDAGLGRRGAHTHAGFSAQVAAQMAAPNFFANPSVTSAAAAAAASAVQSLMAGEGLGHNLAWGWRRGLPAPQSVMHAAAWPRLRALLMGLPL